MKVGLYFGTFNPIHIGHMAIANYMFEYTDINQLWFIVSPQNPFKKAKSLLKDYHRLEMVVRSIDDDERFKASDIEFKLPKPSYTIDTLTYLKDKHPQHEFCLIMGSDNLQSLKMWKNSEIIMNDFRLLVYPRPDYPIEEKSENIHIVEAPLMQISSTFIRQAISEGKNINYFVPSKVWQYIQEMNFYK